jgi:cell division protein FtsL
MRLGTEGSMREESAAFFLGKPIDNSQVVRQVDPRSSREIWFLLVLVALLVSGLVLYAWPALQIRNTGMTTVQLSREKERLLEANRKLRLEKAALENLKRVEAIATRDLGLLPPAPENSVVVETQKPFPPGAQVASGKTEGSASN